MGCKQQKTKQEQQKTTVIWKICQGKILHCSPYNGHYFLLHFVFMALSKHKLAISFWIPCVFMLIWAFLNERYKGFIFLRIVTWSALENKIYLPVSQCVSCKLRRSNFCAVVLISKKSCYCKFFVILLLFFFYCRHPFNHRALFQKVLMKILT